MGWSGGGVVWRRGGLEEGGLEERWGGLEEGWSGGG